MNTQQNTFIPLAQLSTSDRFLYWLSAIVSIGLLRLWPLKAEEIGEDLMRIWDEQRYTPADVLDFSRMADRLIPRLAKYAAKDTGARLPDRPARKRGKTAN